MVVDLFAGSGALGIEALSRGAASVTFVDSERPALAALRANLRSLGVAPRATVVAHEVLGWLAGAPTAAAIADIVFADPPYGFEKWPQLLDLLPAGALVVCESDRPIETDNRHVLFRQKRHGGTVVSLLQPRGAA
jgi:16S rRNA (guanine966-N2)-methyltransferase